MTWGQEVPELQKLAIKITPLMIGSGPAERTWKDVDNILTKKRNRLAMKNCVDLVFVRTWLRRELKIVTDEEIECFKQWETDLLARAKAYAGPVEPDAGMDRQKRIFEDTFEAWEQRAIDGTGAAPRINLGDVKRNVAMKFRLQEKYKGLYFVDKDPDGTYGYYERDGGPAAPAAEWEHRKIFGLIWENRRGWRVETKECNDPTGPSANYIINPTLITMIKESNRNRLVDFRSLM